MSTSNRASKIGDGAATTENLGRWRVLCTFVVLVLAAELSFVSCLASDWEEERPKSKSSQSGKNEESEERAKPTGVTKKQDAGAAGNTATSSAGAEHPLEGHIEKEGTLQSGSALKSLPPRTDDEKPLSGQVRDHQLTPGNPQSDAVDPLKGQIQLNGGKAAKDFDPDEEDVELMVEWDRWHNRFLRAVQLGTQELVNNPDPEDMERLHVDTGTGGLTSRYPLGIGCAFSCIVTAEGQIKNAEILEPSGYPRYDRAVLKSVQQLAGTQILKFPRGSHRRTVIQPGRIKTGNSSEYRYYHFGDVEHVRPPKVGP